jgi:hypothetical protein
LKNKLNFAVEDIRVVDDIDQSQFSLLIVDCFATGRSAHDTIVSEETLRRTAKTIIQKPFVFVVDKRWDDIGSHDKNEVAAGFVPHNTPLEFRTLDDGRVMMSCHVLIWKRYSGELLKYFQRDGNRKSVSVELEVIESREDPKTGLLELVDYCFNAITALGDLIRPAIPNAEAVLAFSQEFEQAKQEYEFSAKYEDVDFTIPKSVKRSAIKSLEMRKEKGKGGTAESLSVARHLSRNEKCGADKVRAINKFFLRKNIYDELVIGLYGGKSASKWAKDLCEKMSQIDDTRVSYFNVEENINLNSDEEEFEDMKKDKKEETKVEEPEKEIEMAAPTEEQPAEKPENEEMAAPSEKEETPEEEKKESPEEEKKEQEDKTEMAAPADEKPEEKEEPKEEEEFSFGFDHAVAMSLFAESEDEKCKMAAEELVKGKDADTSKVMMGLFAACHAMSEACKGMKEEMAALKQFKADIEEQKKNFAVDSTIKELTAKFEIPEEAVNSMREEAAKFEFAQIDGWMNFAKAKAVDFPVIVPKNGKEEVIRIGLPFGMASSRTSKDDLWK